MLPQPSNACVIACKGHQVCFSGPKLSGMTPSMSNKMPDKLWAPGGLPFKFTLRPHKYQGSKVAPSIALRVTWGPRGTPEAL